MNNIAFPLAAVVGPTSFILLMISYSIMVIKYSKRIALHLTIGRKAIMRKSNVTELICAVFSVFLAKRDVSGI